ncbi:MAG: vWA domain-containing protein [Gammaproteobacteria bacterium]
MRRYWPAAILIVLSSVIHALISWHASSGLDPLPPPPQNNNVVRLVAHRDVPEIDPPDPVEPLKFEQPLELEPPEFLIAPTAVVPPPPDVTLALKAESGGIANIDIPVMFAASELMGGVGTGGFKSGIGNALGSGRAQFAAYVANLREVGFDVVFVIDATGSMGWVLEEVKNRIADIAHFVRTLVPVARFGFVAYRDRDDPEFTTKVQQLTYSTNKLQRYLSTLEAKGGGDWFEDIGEGLRDAIHRAGWRPGAQRLIIVIGDAPMRRDDISSITNMVQTFRSSGGIISTLDVSEQANPRLVEAKRGRKVKIAMYRNRPMTDFLLLGKLGHGDAATLDGETTLTRRLVKLVVGDRFSLEIQGLLDQI